MSHVLGGEVSGDSGWEAPSRQVGSGGSPGHGWGPLKEEVWVWQG